MSTKQNPGPYNCYANAMPDEPMFVLLGRDPCAPILVDSWASMRAAMNESSEKVSEAQACAESMRGWLEKLGKKEHRPTNCGPGVLEIGLNEHQNMVVMNLPRDLTGHIDFSPAQARHLAAVLTGKAELADGNEYTPFEGMVKKLNKMASERADALGALSSLAQLIGDTDWDEELHLYDIIDKHIIRHLVEAPTSFAVAMRAVASGNNARRACWPENEFLCKHESEGLVYMKCRKSDADHYDRYHDRYYRYYMPSVECIEALDWEIF